MWPHPPVVGSEIEAFRKVFSVVYPRDVTKLYEAWISVGSLYLDEEAKPSAIDISNRLATVLELEHPAFDITVAAIKIERTYEGSEAFRELRYTSQSSAGTEIDGVDD